MDQTAWYVDRNGFGDHMEQASGPWYRTVVSDLWDRTVAGDHTAGCKGHSWVLGPGDLGTMTEARSGYSGSYSTVSFPRGE